MHPRITYWFVDSPGLGRVPWVRIAIMQNHTATSKPQIRTNRIAMNPPNTTKLDGSVLNINTP